MTNSTSASREADRFHLRLLRTARDPKGRLLTDIGVIDIHQGARTLFADPYRFKVMVESKQIDPNKVCKMIDDQYYDMIICKNDMFSPGYAREKSPFRASWSSTPGRITSLNSR